MKERALQLVEALSPESNDYSRLSVKAIKNAVIGSRKQKLYFIKLGAIEALTAVISSPGASQDRDLYIQAVSTLGSLAACHEGAQKLYDHQGGVSCLLTAFDSPYVEEKEASMRCIKAMCKSGLPPAKHLLESSVGFHAVLYHLSQGNSSIAEYAAIIIAHCCSDVEFAAALVSAIASKYKDNLSPITALADMLGSPHYNRREAALEALEGLIRCSNDEILVTLHNRNLLPKLMKFLRGWPPSNARAALLACSAITNLCRVAERYGALTTRSQHESRSAVLPVLVRLLEGGSLGAQEQAPIILAMLLQDDPSLAGLASDADALSILAQLLCQESATPDLKRGVLSSLAYMCRDEERHRARLVTDCKALQPIAHALQDADPRVCKAACSCMRSLSRSTKLLRGYFAEVEMEVALIHLLESQEIDLIIDVAATIANMALDYDGAKVRLFQHGALKHLIGLAKSSHPVLELHGIWGLSSMAYKASLDIKVSIFNDLSWSKVLSILQSDNLPSKEKVMVLLRNLVYASLIGQESDGYTIIDVMQRLSNFQLLNEVARCCMIAQQPEYDAIATHATYVAVNIASIDDIRKNEVLASPFGRELLPRLLRHRHPAVREAAAWVAINLSWSRDRQDDVKERVHRLWSFGVEEALREASMDTCIAVKERAKTALDQFHKYRPGNEGSNEPLRLDE